MHQRQRQQCAFTRSKRLEVFSDSHKHGENKTTHRSLIVPILTSSLNWEETGPRNCNVIDSTPLRPGVGSRRCARSEGESRPHRIVSQREQCGECRRHRTGRRAAGNCFDV